MNWWSHFCFLVLAISSVCSQQKTPTSGSLTVFTTTQAATHTLSRGDNVTDYDSSYFYEIYDYPDFTTDSTANLSPTCLVYIFLVLCMLA